MNSLRDNMRRLRSIRQTEQILRAMKMVAAVMMRRLQAEAQPGAAYGTAA